MRLAGIGRAEDGDDATFALGHNLVQAVGEKVSKSLKPKAGKVTRAAGPLSFPQRPNFATIVTYKSLRGACFGHICSEYLVGIAMREWSVPQEWTAAEVKEPEAPEIVTDHSLPVRPMRRQPLRKSGGFLQIDNVFAEIDEETSLKH